MVTYPTTAEGARAFFTAALAKVESARTRRCDPSLVTSTIRSSSSRTSATACDCR